jgi:hypothetical protein
MRDAASMGNARAKRRPARASVILWIALENLAHAEPVRFSYGAEMRPLA